MTKFFKDFLKACKLLVKGLFRKRKKKNDKKNKLRAYVYNFSEGRLKNRSWRKNLGKDKKRRTKKKFKLKYR